MPRTTLTLATLAAILAMGRGQESSAACHATCNAACSTQQSSELVSLVVTAATAASDAAELAAVWYNASYSNMSTFHRDDGFYTYAYNFSGVCQAHGAKPNKVGTNINGVFTHVGAQSVNTTALQILRVNLANAGGGWHNYLWPVHLHSSNPGEPDQVILKDKRAYIKKVTAYDGAEYYVGSGFSNVACAAAPSAAPPAPESSGAGGAAASMWLAAAGAVLTAAVTS
jgi:signal transduction histidine kinase